MKNNLVVTTKRLSLFVVLFINVKAYAQYNLVNNGSFEDYSICPNSSLNTPPPNNWYLATNFGGGDYYNSCSIGNVTSVPYNNYGDNYQWARTGNAYIASTVLNMPSQNIRYYYQTKLKDSLKKNKSYYCEFYIVFTNSEKLKCNNISALLSKTAVMVDTIATPFGVLYANAQIYNYGNPIINDTLNWVKVSSIYKAQGGEQYLTLGNFKDDANTNYFASQPTGYNGAAIMIDDVSVIPLDSMPLQADAGRDTTIHIGDSVFIGSYTNGIDTIKWQLQNTGQVIDSVQPGFWVKPLANTCYVLTQTVNGYSSSDTMCVNVLPLPLKFISYTCVPLSQGNDRSVENIWQTTSEVNVNHYNITKSIDGVNFKVIAKVQAENKTLNNYSFIDELTTKDQDLKNLYYRIVGVDNDGKQTYSEVRNIEYITRNNELRIYPNPSKEVVNIVGRDIKEVRIINYLGQQIASCLAMTSNGTKTNHLTLNTNHYPKGLYIVQVVNTNGTVKNEKLVVE